MAQETLSRPLPRWASNPLLHFLLLGGLLFGIEAITRSPPQETISISRARVDQLRATWLATEGEFPSREDEDQLIAQEIDEEILLLHGQEQELHYQVPAVRGRLLNLMRFLYPDSSATEGQLVEDAVELEFHRRDALARDSLLAAARESLVSNVTIKDPTEEELEAFIESLPRGSTVVDSSNPDHHHRLTQAWQAQQRQIALTQELQRRRELVHIRIGESSPSMEEGETP